MHNAAKDANQKGLQVLPKATKSVGNGKLQRREQARGLKVSDGQRQRRPGNLKMPDQKIWVHGKG